MTTLTKKRCITKDGIRPQAGVLPFLPAPADYTEIPGSAIDPKLIINLTEKLQPDGTLNWNVPQGNWTIIRFGRRNNGILTRPAPVPGLGMECDKFDTVSLNAHYQTYISKLIEKVQHTEGSFRRWVDDASY